MQRVTTPILLQMHATECGAACLGMVLGHFGRWVPLTELRERCEVSRDGSSAASIVRAARHYGLESNGLSVRAKSLHRLQLPLIVFWQFSHFLVVEGFEGDFVYLKRPGHGAPQGFRRGVRRELQRNCAAIQARRRLQARRRAARPVGAIERPARRRMERADGRGRLRAHAGVAGARRARVPGRFRGRRSGRPGALGRAGGGPARRRRPRVPPVPAQAPLPAAAGDSHLGHRLRPGPVAAAAAAGGFLCPPAGRRPDRSGSRPSTGSRRT